MSQRKLVIAVIGASQPSEAEAALAEEVGKEIAKRGAILVCGGLGGIMEAASRGAHSEGGTVIGVLPGTDPDDANPYVTIPIATGVRQARNLAVVNSAKAVIAISGGYGTLSEIAFSLSNGLPVIGLETWHISRNGTEDPAIIYVSNAQEAVTTAIKLAEKRQEEKNGSN